MQLAGFIKYMRRNKSEETIKGYICSLNKFKAYLGNNKGTRANVDAYVQHLIDTNNSPASVHRHYWAVKSYFNYLGIGETIKGIQLPKLMLSDAKSATKDEIESLLNYEHLTARESLMIVLTYTLGLRVGELLRIKIEHYDPEVHSIRITSEKKRSGALTDTMHLEKKAWTDLESYIKTLTFTNGFLFSPDGVKAISPDTVRNHLAQLCRAIGIRYLNPHSFRHGRGTDLAISGASKEQIRQYLRQRSDKTASRYIHMKGMDLKDKIPPAFITEEKT